MSETRYEIVIGSREGERRRYDKFRVTVPSNCGKDWYNEWEGGGESLWFPNCQKAKSKWIDAWGDYDNKGKLPENLEEVWTESKKKLKKVI
jgi:hypothetical protein